MGFSDNAAVGTVKGDWVCESKLGTGSFGIVHVWANRVTKETIAVKKCRFGAEVTMSDKHKEQWKQEVAIMLRLDHQNVVHCMPLPSDLADPNEDLPMLCMEFCKGGDLRRRLNDPRNCCGLPEADVLAVISDLASALGYLHNRRIIHRDLKPENVVLNKGSDRIVYKLIDLGYAKELGKSSLAMSFVGTLQYLAPELFLSQEYTKTVDYWSLGLITHEIITGLRPFLPNLNPGQWMEFVEKKPRKVVCIHQQGLNGDILNRDTLFPENFIGSSLQRDLEEWLRTLLDFNPTLRGKNDKGEITVFKDLAAILSKQRIRIVLMDKCICNLDYAILENTTGKDLKQWIQRDLKIDFNNQLIVLANGSELKSFDIVLQQLHGGERVAFVYDLKRTDQRIGDRIKGTAVLIPSAIHPYLQNPRQEVEFSVKKYLYAQGYFFMRQEQLIRKNLAVGVKTFIQFLLNEVKSIGLVKQSVNKNYDKALAKYELFQESLFHDIEKYREQAQRKDHVLSNTIFESWQKSDHELQTVVGKLRDKVRLIEERSGDVHGEMQRIRNSKPMYNEERCDLVDRAVDNLANLKKIPIEGRKEKDNVIDMAQIVVKCLKRRDAHLQEYFTRLSQVTNLYQQLNELRPCLDLLEQELSVATQSISKHQRKRQSDVWKLMSAAVKNSGGGSQGRVDPPTPQSSPFIFDLASSETRQLVADNQAIRFNMQALLDETMDAVNKHKDLSNS